MPPQAVTRADQVLRWTCPRSPGGDRRPLRSKRRTEPHVALVISFSGDECEPEARRTCPRVCQRPRNLRTAASGTERSRGTSSIAAVSASGPGQGEHPGADGHRCLPIGAASSSLSPCFRVRRSVQRRRHPVPSCSIPASSSPKASGSPRRVTRFTSTSSSTATRSGSRR
jgi:hypothetical protein